MRPYMNIQRNTWVGIFLAVLAVFAVAMLIRSNSATRLDIQEEVAPASDFRHSERTTSDATLEKGVPDDVMDRRNQRK